MADKIDKKADIIDVAKAARVSPSTVSRSFNHPELVKANTRKKIDAAVRRLGYIRNRAAQTIHGIRSGTIGLIVPTIDHAIFAELIQSFSDAVEELGFTILLASHGYSLNREYALTRKMLEHRVDGMALIGIEHSEDTYGLLDQQSMPSVLLWNYSDDAPLTCVGSDNFEAGNLIGAHVAGLGHRDIATLFPPLAGNDRAQLRFDGVRQALKAHDVRIRDHWTFETPYSVAEAKLAVETLVKADKHPTAVICGNDVLAWGAIYGLMKNGLRVPDDLTVTGIGDFKGSKEFEPGLTTVRIPARQIGAQGAKRIVEAIVSDAPVSVGDRIAPELIVRATSAIRDVEH